MNCRKCGNQLSGETAHIGAPMCAASGYADDYLLLITCPRCSATHSIRMWQSESSAVEDAEADEESEAA